MTNFNWTPRAQDYKDSIDLYSRNSGEENINRQWLSTPFDTWVKNPHYIGEDQPHPEDDDY